MRPQPFWQTTASPVSAVPRIALVVEVFLVGGRQADQRPGRTPGRETFCAGAAGLGVGGLLTVFGGAAPAIPFANSGGAILYGATLRNLYKHRCGTMPATYSHSATR